MNDPIVKTKDIVVANRTEINLLEDLADKKIKTTNQNYVTTTTNVILEPNTKYVFSVDYEFISREGILTNTRVDLMYSPPNGLAKVLIKGIWFPDYEKGTVGGKNSISNYSGEFTTKAELGEYNGLAIRIPSADSKQSIEMWAGNFELIKVGKV